jgi:hypothetical protein
MENNKNIINKYSKILVDKNVEFINESVRKRRSKII